MIFLSFLLNGDKMRQRLAQILAQAEASELNQEQHNEGRNQVQLSHTSSSE